MKPLLYLISLLLVLPWVSLAVLFATLDHVLSQGPTLGALAAYLWTVFVSLVDAVDRFGLFVLLAPAGFVCALVALLALGLSDHYRWIGVSVIALAGASSLVVVLLATGIPRTGGELAFHAPGVVALALCVWMLAAEQRPPRATPSAPEHAGAPR